MSEKEQELNAFKELLKVMDTLREQCPWDQKQTFKSLRHLTIEETYELGDAILDDDIEEIKNELGDLLLHIVFYSKIGSETNAFSITEVCQSITEKLIRRHPHIYSNISVKDENEVKQNWEQIKLKEGKKSVLEGVPKSLPALIKAYRMQEKAAGVGFDWEKPEDVWNKVKEELSEFKTEIDQANQDQAEAEFGDVLFSLINYARFVNINPEDALERTNKKFINRFLYIEKQARAQGKQLNEMTLAEMDVYWNEAKKIIKTL